MRWIGADLKGIASRLGDDIVGKENIVEQVVC